MAAFYLEVGGIDRFPSAKQFFSYCRLVPGAADSGRSRRHKSSKDGNRYLKLAFSHAGVRAVQYYPVVRSFYARKAREKPEAVARAIVAKEIARIAYHVLRKQEDFNGRFKGTPPKPPEEADLVAPPALKRASPGGKPLRITETGRFCL